MECVRRLLSDRSEGGRDGSGEEARTGRQVGFGGAQKHPADLLQESN